MKIEKRITRGPLAGQIILIDPSARRRMQSLVDPRDINRKFFDGSAEPFFSSGIGLIVTKTNADETDLKTVVPRATCILVHPEWILTAHHVLDTLAFAQNFEVVFGYFGAFPSLPLASKFAAWADIYHDSEHYSFCNESGCFFSSRDGTLSKNAHTYAKGDWALAKLARPVDARFIPMPATRLTNATLAEEKPEIRVPFFQGVLTDDPEPFPPCRPLNIFSRPQNASNPLDPDANRVHVIIANGREVHHSASAHGGASGAPLAMNDGSFLGIHVRSALGTPTTNKGTSATFIANALRSQEFPALNQLTLANALDPPL
jgi:Trypsin-like peptidase domain